MKLGFSFICLVLFLLVFQNCDSHLTSSNNNSKLSETSSEVEINSLVDSYMREFVRQSENDSFKKSAVSTATTSVTNVMDINNTYRGPKFGMFYSLWHCPFADGVDDLPPPDMTQIEKMSSLTSRITRYEDYLKKGVTQFWQDRPQFGYYCINNTSAGRARARLHAIQLRDMGIDFILADFTNNAISPLSLDVNNPNSCHYKTVYNFLKPTDAKSSLSSSCIGYDTSRNTQAILTAFKILLEEWSKISGAPKIVPWVPITRLYSAKIAVLTGKIRHDHRLTIADIVNELMVGDVINSKYKELVLINSDTNNKPLILNTVNQLFPEDENEVKRVMNRGFHVENAWARFPSKDELDLDLPFMNQINVFGKMMQQQSPHYRDHKTLLWKSLISNSNIRAIEQIVVGESIESYLSRIKNILISSTVSKTDKDIIKAELKRSANLTEEYFWHSTDINKMWRWRAPCRNPKSFKLSNANNPCNQRVSQDGRVVNVSTAFEWVSFAEESTSVPQIEGRVFDRYFETFENNYSSTAKFVIIDSWNEWVSPFRRCSFTENAILKPGTTDQKLTFVGGAKSDNINTNNRSINYVNSNLKRKNLSQIYSGIANVDFNSIDSLRQPVEYWSGSEFGSRVATICQDLSPSAVKASFRWIRDSQNNRVRPHFHHHWTGEYRSDIEPGSTSGSRLYWQVTDKILDYKRRH